MLKCSINSQRLGFMYDQNVPVHPWDVTIKYHPAPTPQMVKTSKIRLKPAFVNVILDAN